jgi:hypothetical protein
LLYKKHRFLKMYGAGAEVQGGENEAMPRYLLSIQQVKTGALPIDEIQKKLRVLLPPAANESELLTKNYLKYDIIDEAYRSVMKRVEPEILDSILPRPPDEWFANVLMYKQCIDHEGDIGAVLYDGKVASVLRRNKQHLQSGGEDDVSIAAYQTNLMKFKMCMSHYEYLIANIEMLIPYLDDANEVYQHHFTRERLIGEGPLLPIYQQRLYDRYSSIFTETAQARLGFWKYFEIAVAFRKIQDDPTRHNVKLYHMKLSDEVIKALGKNVTRLEAVIYELTLAARYTDVYPMSFITLDLLVIAHLHMIPWQNVLHFYSNLDDVNSENLTGRELFIMDSIVHKFLRKIYKEAATLEDDIKKNGINFRLPLITRVILRKLDISQLKGTILEDLNCNIFILETIIDGIQESRYDLPLISSRAHSLEVHQDAQNKIRNEEKAREEFLKASMEKNDKDREETQRLIDSALLYGQKSRAESEQQWRSDEDEE